jgi:ribonuclease HI
MTTTGAGIALYTMLNPDAIHTDCAFLGLATVFQAELHAITMACQAAEQHPEARVTLFSDSQAAIYAIAKPCIQSRTLQAAVIALNTLAGNKFVHLRWIKGHNNSNGNDMADSMAKQGTKAYVYGPFFILPIPLVQIKAITAQIVLEMWAAPWARHKPCT